MASPSAAAQEKIQQLQILEQSIASLHNQKQNFQLQLSEVSTALDEIKGQDRAFKIVGGIMVEKPVQDLTLDLTAHKEMLEVRIKSVENQEQKMNQKKEMLQHEVMALLNPLSSAAGSSDNSTDDSVDESSGASGGIRHG